MNPSDSEFESEQERLSDFFRAREEKAGRNSAGPDERTDAVLLRARRQHSIRSTVSLAVGRLGAGLMGFIQTILLLLTHGTGPHSERIRRRVERAVSESDIHISSDS